MEIYFVKDKKDKDKKLLYIPKYNYLEPVENSFIEEIKKKNPVALKSLESKLKGRAIKLKKPSMDRDNYINTVEINITDDCNLRCRYCYLESDQDSNHDIECRRPMTKKQYKTLIHMLIKQKVESHSSPVFTIVLYGGGEPTVDEEFFRYCVNYAKEYGLKNGIIVRFLMTTNGYYNNLSDFIIENIESLTFSLDGPEDVHNHHRPAIGGINSFQKVFNNAKTLYQAKIPMTFRITVSDYTLKRWKEIMDFFIENFSGCNLLVGPMVAIGRGSGSVLKVPNKVEFTEKIYDSFLYTRNKINLTISASTGVDNPRYHYCGASRGDVFIISSDGSVNGCAYAGADERFNHGKFDFETGIMHLNKDAIEKSTSLNVQNYKECQNCFCKYMCAGGCPDLRYTNAGINSCTLNRNIIEHILNEKIYGVNSSFI